MLRSLLAPLTAGSTYRAYVHLLLGAVMLLPYGAVAALFVLSVVAGGLDAVSLVALIVVAVVVGGGVTLVPGVRTLEITAARALFGARIPEPDPTTVDSWPARRRAVVWLLVVLAAGALTALATLIVVPWALGFLLAPWVAFGAFPTGLAAAWAPLVGVALPVGLLHAVSGAGAGLARMAPWLLGPSTAERLTADLAAARAAERTLAHRNRLARELHDSVGHALTITTLQAGAAARVLDTDRAFVAAALEAIAEAGRTALEELDHVLGVLRDGGGDAAAPDLGDLDALTAGTGVLVDVRTTGDPATVPGLVSREAYRIVQEALTNALRHAGPVPVTVAVAVGAECVTVEIVNPVGDAPPGGGGGRGLTGMRERVTVLGGELSAGPDPDGWRVLARLPWPDRMGS